jgi:putative DNA primase/helicase
MTEPAPYPRPELSALVDPAQLSEHLELLFGYVDFEPHHVVGLRGIGEKGTPQEGKHAEQVWIQVGAGEVLLDSVVAAARTWAQWGVATFIIPGVLSRCEGTADAVELMTALVVDLDKHDTDAKLAYLQEATRIRPDLVVRSGGTTDTGHPKRHVWYRLTEPTRDVPGVMAVRHRLAQLCGGDLALGLPADARHGVDRGRAHQPIRLAGTVHGKGGGARLVSIER